MLKLADAEVAALGDLGFLVRDGFLGRADALALHAEAQARGHGLRPAGVSRGAGYRIDPATRGDEIAWLAPDDAWPALAPLWDRFAALRDTLNREAYLGLTRFDVQLARYPGGGACYRRHRDAFPGRSGRRVTAIYYLNPGWRPDRGGLLRLHLADGPRDVEPVLDRLVVFLSERLPHEVLPVFATRLAVTAWYYGRDGLAPSGLR
jgi:SM-20-related protein